MGPGSVSAAAGFAAFQRAGWERVAERYAARWPSLTAQFGPALLAAAGVGPGAVVLDAGSGPGDVAEAARRRGATAVAYDLSRAMAVLARSRYPGLASCRGDAQLLPFRDGAFDAIVMNFVLLHVPAPERALAEAARVVRPGGRLAFTVWAEPERSPGEAITETAFKAHVDPSRTPPPGPAAFGFGSLAERREKLERAGFRGASLTAELVTAVWRVPSSDYLFDAEREGTVRTGGLLALQTPETLAAIRRAVAENARPYAVPEGLAVPYGAYVVAVTR